MKGCLFTDIHWGRRNNSVEHNQDCMDFIDWMLDIVNKEKIEWIGFLGDWFESRTSIEISTLNLAYTGAIKLSKLGIPVYFCVGNHDLFRRTTREFFSTVHYEDIPNFRIINEPTTINFGEKTATFFPYMFEAEYEAINNHQTDYWLGHFEFSGFEITSYGTIKHDGPSHSSFKNIKRILSGHFHKRQTKDNTTFIGNAFPMDFGDVDSDDRGCCIFDTEKNNLKFINWDSCPKYRKVNFTDIANGNFSDFQQKMRIRCIVNQEDVSHESQLDLKQSLMEQYGIREITFINEKQIQTIEDVEIDVQQCDLDSLVDQCIDQVKDDAIDNNALKQIYKLTGNNIDSKINSTHLPIQSKTLILRNFKSFGNNDTIIDLDKKGFNSIVGKNKDVETPQGFCRNGVGKTVTIEAIAYACFDQPLSNKLNLDDLINWTNQKNLMVTYIFSNGIMDYKIIRKRKGGKNFKTNSVELFEVSKDGTEKDITRDSTAETNKAIKNIIGIDFETFKRVVIFSATTAPFLDLPYNSASGASQIDVIEDIFKIKELSIRAENLKKIIKEKQQELSIETSIIEKIEQQNANNKREYDKLIALHEGWEREKIQKISNLEEQLRNIPQVDDINQQLAIHDSIVELNQELKTIQNEISQINSTLSSYIKEKKEIDKQLEALAAGTCPYCKQSHVDDHKIASLVKSNKKIQKNIEALSASVNDLTTEQREIIEDVDNFKRLLRFSNIKDIVASINSVDMIKHNLDLAKKSTNPYTIVMNQLVTIVQNNIDYNNQQTLVKFIEHSQFLYKMLTKKDSFMRKALMRINLPFLNKQLKEYLTKLALPHDVAFDEELQSKINFNGRVISYDNLSTGQKARINLALSLAFRDVLERMHAHIDICMFDECLDVGLSGVGIQLAIKMLKQKAVADKLKMFVITHRDDINMNEFTNTLEIEYSNGFVSSVEYLTP